MLSVFAEIQNLEPVTLTLLNRTKKTSWNLALSKDTQYCRERPDKWRQKNTRGACGALIRRIQPELWSQNVLCRSGDVFVVVQVLLRNVIFGHLTRSDF